MNNKRYWEQRLWPFALLYSALIFFCACSDPVESIPAPEISKVWVYVSANSGDRINLTMDLRPDGKYYDTLIDVIGDRIDETETRAGTYTYTDTKLIVVTDQTYTFGYVMTGADMEHKLYLTRAGETKELFEARDY